MVRPPGSQDTNAIQKLKKKLILITLYINTNFCLNKVYNKKQSKCIYALRYIYTCPHAYKCKQVGLKSMAEFISCIMISKAQIKTASYTLPQNTPETDRDTGGIILTPAINSFIITHSVILPLKCTVSFY